MTEKIHNVVVIAEEAPRECELCGKFEECRPAGPNGEQVCFDCAEKNPEAMKAYSNRLFGRTQ